MPGFFSVSGQFEYDPAKGRFRGYLKRATLNAVRARYRRHRAPAQLEDKSLVADPTTDAVAWDHEWWLSVLNRALREVATRFEAATSEAATPEAATPEDGLGAAKAVGWQQRSLDG